MSEQQKYLVVVRGIVINRDGNILLIKRSAKHNYYPLKWELPGGRLVSETDSRESLFSTIHRETGLIVKVGAERFYTYSRNITEEGKYKGYVYVEITTACKLAGGNITLAKDEHVDHAWASLSDMFSYDLSLESKKALAEYCSEHQEKINIKNATVRLVGRALITNKDGKHLILQRANNQQFPKTWELPGGKISSFETLPLLLKREVFEETNLAIKITDEILHFDSQIRGHGRHSGSTYVNIISGGEVVAGNLKLSPDHSNYEWASESRIINKDLAPYLKLPLTELFLGKK